MVSPNLTRKSQNELTFTEAVKKLFQVIFDEQKKTEKENENVAKIKVSDLISKIAFYYEKIRNSVDYKEENMLRKSAVERILKRQIVIEGAIKAATSEKIAEYLLVELIRAGYLPNNKIPESKIQEVNKIISKYIKLRNYSLARVNFSGHLKTGRIDQANEDLKARGEISDWIMSLVASEIEENLDSNRINKIAISGMYEILIKNVKFPEGLYREKEKEVQIYLSIYRNFLKIDDDMLGFVLFKYFNPHWTEDIKDEDIIKISQNITPLRQVIAEQLNHSISRQLNKIVSQYSVYFSVLIEVIGNDPVKVYNEMVSDTGSFTRLIKQTCQKKYKHIKSKLWRAAVRSIIYIFLTKSIFAILIEIPATQWFGEKVNSMSLAINVGFPAFLLFLIVLLTDVPSEKNTEKIANGIEEITFAGRERQDPIILRQPKKRGKLTGFVFGILYFITFFLSFGLVVWGLNKINFTWVSVIIFLFFLAMVSFFGIRIRRGIREFNMIEPKENFFSLLLSFFYTPIIAVGHWLSGKFSQINIFVFVLDFIIEAPFKIFVEITEDWTRYVKERRDDMVN